MYPDPPWGYVYKMFPISSLSTSSPKLTPPPPFGPTGCLNIKSDDFLEFLVCTCGEMDSTDREFKHVIIS